MTTGQIIFLCLLFIVETSILWRLMHLKGYMALDSIIHVLRISVTFGVFIFSFAYLNKYEKQAIGKCPQYEQISEPVYKLK